MFKLLILVSLLIIYGSFYPFNFMLLNDTNTALNKVLNFEFYHSGKSDIAANILLFIPFGILVFKCLGEYKTILIRLLLSGVIAFVFAYFIQILQLWTPSRVPSGSDAIWNLLGCIIGCFISIKFFPSVLALNKDTRDYIYLLLGLSIIFSHLTPFAPSFDLDSIQKNIKLFIYKPFSLFTILEHFILWLVSFFFINQSHLKFKTLQLCLIVLAVFMGKFFIINNDTSLQQCFSALLAITFWRYFANDITPKFVLSLLIINLFIYDFYPFEFKNEVGNFHWLPFIGSLGGNIATNITAFIYKSVLYSSLLWVMVECHFKIKKATLILAAFIFLIEVLQIYFIDATAEITDAILVMIIGYAFHLLLRQQGTKIALEERVIDPELISADTHLKQSTQEHNSIDWLARLKKYKLLLSVIGMMMIGQFFVMQLPHLPYNIVELYKHNGNVFDYLFLSLALLSLCLGPVWGSRDFPL